jgi:hypothetical protein
VDGEDGRGRLWSLATSCLTTKYSLRAGAHSHTKHANLFRNSSLFHTAHTGPAGTGEISGPGHTLRTSPLLSFGCAPSAQVRTTVANSVYITTGVVGANEDFSIVTQSLNCHEATGESLN